MQISNKRYGFSLVETLMSLLVLSIILAAALPIVTVKSKTKTSPWFYDSTNSNIYYAADTNQGVSIGADTLTDQGSGLNSKLEIKGTENVPQVYIKGNSTQTNNIVEIVNSSGTELFTVDNDGNVDIDGLFQINGTSLADGSPVTFSDIRLKDILSDYSYGLDEVLKLKTVNYRFKKDNKLKLESKKSHAGVIAQDLQKIMPEAVSEGRKDFLQIDKEYMFYAMINSIKELKLQNDELKKQNDSLMADVKSIKKQIASMNKSTVSTSTAKEETKSWWTGFVDWLKGLFR